MSRSIKVSKEFQPTPVAQDRECTKDKKTRKGRWPIRKPGRSGLDSMPDHHHQPWSECIESEPESHVRLTFQHYSCFCHSPSFLLPYFRARTVLSPKICVLKPSLNCLLLLSLHTFFFLIKFNFLASLRYIWHIILYKFKVYNLLIWYIYVLQNDYQHSLANTCIITHNYHFFFVVRTFEIHSLSNFQVYNTLLLTVVTMLYLRSPELIPLITGSLYIWSPSPIFPCHLPLVTTILVCFYEFGFF